MVSHRKLIEEPFSRPACGARLGARGASPKLARSAVPALTTGGVGVDVYLTGQAPGNAGIIVKVVHAGPGADNFDGYEISIDAARKVVNLGRHRHDWKLLAEAPCDA